MEDRIYAGVTTEYLYCIDISEFVKDKINVTCENIGKKYKV